VLGPPKPRRLDEPIAVSMRWRSERIPWKTITNWSVKKTTGSMLSWPRSA
jgi:hypothetical protein